MHIFANKQPRYCKPHIFLVSQNKFEKNELLKPVSKNLIIENSNVFEKFLND